MYSSPPCHGLLGGLPTWRNSLPLGLGTGAEGPQTCGVPPFEASPSWRALHSFPLVSSDTVTPLVCYVCKMHSHNLEIVQMYCAISRLAHGFWILRMHSTILRLRKFQDCMEDIRSWGLCIRCDQHKKSIQMIVKYLPEYTGMFLSVLRCPKYTLISGSA